MKKYHRVLTIAGSDSGGGAGIQADLKTFSALGCFGASAITALTAQNTLGVSAIEPVSPSFIQQQIEAVLTDLGVDAVKIGMLHSAEVIWAVVETFEKYPTANIVLDPVMVAKSGDRLLEEEAVQALKTGLIPLAKLITPNLPEAAVLQGGPVAGPEGMEQAARKLARLGSQAVLLKGGHLEGGRSPDLLFEVEANRVNRYVADRIDTKNDHGTGCTLSSAIAAGLAQGIELAAAVSGAKQYLTRALQKGARYRLGAGHGPVHHFWKYWS